ncbi:MAG: metallophosphoesterase family protein [Candidatus Aenigmatarchaeota archaeon]
MWKRKIVTAITFLFILGGVLMFSESSLPNLEEKNVTVENDEVVIGVLSDTHVTSRTKKIPETVLNTFREGNVNLILHAGNLVNEDVLNKLEDIAPIIAVKGNMDPRSLDLPKGVAVNIKDYRIGMIHNTINPLSSKMDRLVEKEKLNAIIFGHTHTNHLERKDNTWYINPGSPTDPKLSDASFAIMEIDGNITAKLINV